MNSLLDFAGLPKFHSFSPELVKPAIDELIADAERVVGQVTAANEAPTWANVVTPIDDVTEKLGRAWGVVGHLNAVVNSPALRDAYNGMLPTITQFWTQLSQNEALFTKYKQIRTSSDTFAANGTPVGDFGGDLTAAQIRALDNEIRDFRLGGAELSAEKKAKFQAIQEELSTLMSKFNDNVLDATNAFGNVVVDQSELAGLPADVIQAASESAKADGQAGWKFTLQAPSYMPVMQYADHQPLRELMYRAYVTRASELGAKIEWDNSAVIKRILELRKESASLLGYKNYAEVSLSAKMAETPGDVVNFLNEMATKSRPFAEQDWRELNTFAHEQLNMAEVNAWDVGYVSEKLRQQRYAFSDNDVKQYFPESKVIAGLFRVVESIYGITFAKSTAETWHTDVQFYAHGKLQHPVAFMTCNFPAPVGRGDQQRPALFTHDDVITLFHEFGHGLHQLLTEVDELGVSGINGVEWDAVELPSQFMENFCWEWDVLRHMTAHVETGEPLPRSLFDKMIAAKNFQAGMQFLRQIEFALLDMQSHTDFDPTREDIMALVQRVREQVAVVQYPSFNRMPHAFGHIFGGGYAAGYYSYKWAEVLSADAYAAFEESGVLNQETGAKFRREVLARGGSRPAMESFIAFRGRKPEIEHLLRHNGMKLAA